MTARSAWLSRRAALLTPLALAGCGLFNGDWFGSSKPPLPGKRESVFASENGLSVDEGVGKVVLPPATRNANWPQFGGNPAHLMGHLAARDNLEEVWKVSIGEGGGYRQVLMAQPVVLNGRVFAMDSDAVVTAYSLADGKRIWRADSKPKKADSTNVGGGLAADGDRLYAVNGLSQLVAYDNATGKEQWRRDIGVPARSAPTVADGRIFVTTIVDQLLAFATADGHQLWNFQATSPVTAMLGQPAPSYYRGLVISGFGSGELAALHADSGSSVWTDGLGASQNRATVPDLLSIRGAPVIANGLVYAVSMGGLLVCDDVPTGRRVWERHVAGEDTPYVAGDWMFIVSVQQQIAAVSLNDGRVAWVSQLPRWTDPDTRKNTLTCTGAILGRIKLSEKPAPFSPVVADGTVLVLTNNARLIALR
jgi:outer membrane protein assembly factor BamB